MPKRIRCTRRHRYTTLALSPKRG